MNPEQHDRLEQWVTSALKTVPPRSAPAGLESRVLAEIERRAAQPWWRKQFMHWPPVARWAFLLTSPLFVKLALMASDWITGDSPVAEGLAEAAPGLTWVRVLSRFAESMIETVPLLLRHLPASLLYGGLIVMGLYVALFGLGAAAYRTLYSAR